MSLFKYNAFVVDVYDGDTITCDIELGFGVKLHNQKVRLYGINTPELRGDTYQAGIAARDYLREQILNKKVIIKTIENKKTNPDCDKKGKYGRWLGVIYYNEKNINELMIEKGYAKIYSSL